MSEGTTETTHTEPMSGVLSGHRNPSPLEGHEEVWETNVLGRVWLNVTNKRDEIVPISITKGQKLRITKRDREMNQDRIKLPERDPFTNGVFRRIDADQNTDPRTVSTDALSTEELIAIFAKNGGQFEKAVSALQETPIRRMYVLADDLDATVNQVKFLKELLESRYGVGGDTPTYRELKRLDQVATQGS